MNSGKFATVSISGALYAKLRAYCQTLGCSVSGLVEDIINDTITPPEHEDLLNVPTGQKEAT